MTTIQEYAALAALVYNDQRGGGGGEATVNLLALPAGWKNLSALGFAGSTLVDLNPFSFTAGAYVNAAGEIVIAYKGTDFITEFDGRSWNTVGDLLADAGLAAAFSIIGLPQLLSASTYYLAVKEWAVANGYDSEKITFTGHSLGGGLASVMSVWFDQPATTFAEAPFEQSAIDPLFVLAAADALTIQAGVSASAAVLEEINKLRDLLVPMEYQERQEAVTNYFVSGEMLTYLRAFMPTVVGAGKDIPIDIGAQPLGRSVGLHSMNLHLALLLDTRLQEACRKIPELVPTLLDGGLYAFDPNTSRRDFVTALVADQLQGDIARQDGLLGKFTAEVLKLQGDTGLSTIESVRSSLIAVAIEYCYFNSEAGVTSLFTVSDGGVHFRYSDIGASRYKSLRRLTDAVVAMQDSLGLDQGFAGKSARNGAGFRYFG